MPDPEGMAMAEKQLDLMKRRKGRSNLAVALGTAGSGAGVSIVKP